MAELSAEAPLAKFESDDWIEYSEYQQQTETNGNNNRPNKLVDNVKKNDGADNFDSFSGSLEDLVNTFDEKITKCFHDLDQNVETLAPVQIRNQDDIINECQ